MNYIKDGTYYLDDWTHDKYKHLFTNVWDTTISFEDHILHLPNMMPWLDPKDPDEVSEWLNSLAKLTIDY